MQLVRMVGHLGLMAPKLRQPHLEVALAVAVVATMALEPAHYQCQAVQVVADSDGNPACADPSGGCVPLNVIGTPTQDAIDYVTARTTDRTTVEQAVFAANLTGELFDLPAGPFAFAAGFTWRDESAKYTPDTLYTDGLARFERTGVDGGFDSTEFYVEALVPLLGGDLDTPGWRSP